MGNVLSAEKRQQVIALGRLGWSLRRIEEATGVRRETASTYLRASGVVVRRPGRWGQLPKPAIEVSTDSDAVPAANPANGAGVSTDSAAAPPLPRPGRSPAASACEPYRELIAAIDDAATDRWRRRPPRARRPFGRRRRRPDRSHDR